MWKNENREKWVFLAEIRTSDSFQQKKFKKYYKFLHLLMYDAILRVKVHTFCTFGPPASKKCVLQDGTLLIF